MQKAKLKRVGNGKKSFRLTEINDLGENLKNSIGLFKITDLKKKFEKITYGLAKITDLGEKFEENTYRLGIKVFEIPEKNIQIGD